MKGAYVDYDFIATGSSLTVSLTGLAGGDTNAFVDAFSLATVPEPSSIVALCGLSAMGLALAIRFTVRINACRRQFNCHTGLNLTKSVDGSRFLDVTCGTGKQRLPVWAKRARVSTGRLRWPVPHTRLPGELVLPLPDFVGQWHTPVLPLADFAGQWHTPHARG